MKSAAAEMATKAKTPQPSGTSKSVVSLEAVPGGPVMYVAVTGSEKPLVRKAMATASMARTTPTPTFQTRRRPRRR